jgi:hypothetical protein
MKRKGTPAAQGFILCGRCGRDVKDGAKWFKAHDKVCGLKASDPEPEPRERPGAFFRQPPPAEPESEAARALREKMLKYAAKFSVDLMESLKPRD